MCGSQREEGKPGTAAVLRNVPTPRARVKCHSGRSAAFSRHGVTSVAPLNFSPQFVSLSLSEPRTATPPEGPPNRAPSRLRAANAVIERDPSAVHRLLLQEARAHEHR